MFRQPGVEVRPLAAVRTGLASFAMLACLVAPALAGRDPGTLDAVVDQIGARALWDRGVTGRGVTVAVIDSGVAPVPALSGPDKVVAMADLSSEAGIPEAIYLDTYGHGTHMMGIIAGRDERGGFRGVAPDAALVSVKAGDSTGAVDVSQVIAALEWVVQHATELDVRVLNLSFGSNGIQTYLTDPLAHAVEQAWQAGIVVVVAAGNDGRGELQLGNPALDPYVIAVGAAKAHDDGSFSIPDWSTRGNGVRNPDVAAPGAHIVSLRAPGSRVDVEHPGGYVSETLFRGSGSSQAAAVVSGAVALLLDARPELSPDQVKWLLRQTARSIEGRPRLEGQGLIDVTRAARTRPSYFATQRHLPGTGLGSLDLARGTDRLLVNGLPLIGERTVLGDAWTGASWRGDLWTAGRWDGERWTGASWRGASWRDASWMGARWSGASWRGASWRSAAWSGASWRGSEWTAASWTGASWRESSWTGASWRAGTWEGASWRQERWE